MYRKLRSIHLCAGVFSLLFLAVYAVSALQMTHGKWVHMEAHTTNRDLSLTPNLTDARAVAADLAARYGISGELAAIRVRPGALQFRILRPGMIWQTDYTVAAGSARLRITDTGTLGALNRIHQMRGLWHTWIAYNIWVALLALVSLGLLTLGASGIYLWWKTHRDRRLTGALLAFSIAIIGGLAAWMRMGA